MSQTNVEKVKQIYAAFGRRDLAAVFALVSTEVEIVQSTQLPWGGNYRGHDGLRKFLEKLTQHVNSAVIVDRFIDAGNNIVAIGRTQGTVIASGQSFDVPVAHVWELRDGLIVRFMPYVDHPTVLAAM